MRWILHSGTNSAHADPSCIPRCSRVCACVLAGGQGRAGQGRAGQQHCPCGLREGTKKTKRTCSSMGRHRRACAARPPQGDWTAPPPDARPNVAGAVDPGAGAQRDRRVLPDGTRCRAMRTHEMRTHAMRTRSLARALTHARVNMVTCAQRNATTQAHVCKPAHARARMQSRCARVRAVSAVYRHGMGTVGVL
jgi:hypothetical protein